MSEPITTAPAATGWRDTGAILFPPLPPPGLGLHRVLALLAAVAVATGLLLARQTGPGALDVLYAEDGVVFLADARASNLSDNLLEPYAGYAHVVPRLLFEPIAELPLEQTAVAVAVTACVATALLAALLFRALAGHISSTTLRVLAASSLVLLPAGQEEVFDTVTNLHWFLVPVAAVLLLWNPESRIESALGASVVFLAAASDPITAVLVPLALVRVAAAAPRLWARTAPLALGAGLVLQALVMAGGGDTRAALEPALNPAQLGGWWAFDVPGRTLAGTRWVSEIGEPASWIGVGAALALLAAVGGLALRRLRPADLVVPVVLVVQGALLYLAYAGLAGTRPPRYGVPAGILLIVALAVVADRLRTVPLPTRTRAAAAAVAVAVVVVGLLNFRVDNSRSSGPAWSTELARVREQCRATGMQLDDLVRITVPPVPGLQFEVPCRDVSVADS